MGVFKALIAFETVIFSKKIINLNLKTFHTKIVSTMYFVVQIPMYNILLINLPLKIHCA